MELSQFNSRSNNYCDNFLIASQRGLKGNLLNHASHSHNEGQCQETKSAKIFGSADKDQGAKYQPTTAKKNTFCSQNPNLNCWIRKIIKISLFLNVSLSFSTKIREHKDK